jgi:putative SOS response-associated peptidase YedK
MNGPWRGDRRLDLQVEAVPDPHRQRLGAHAGEKQRDQQLVERGEKREERGQQDARQRDRQHDPAKDAHTAAAETERSLEVMRWGLVPFWAKDIKVGFADINAKPEGIENKPAFREAFQQRRCLAPVDSFYEWKKVMAASSPTRSGSRAAA